MASLKEGEKHRGPFPLKNDLWDKFKIISALYGDSPHRRIGKLIERDIQENKDMVIQRMNEDVKA